jgi:predicted Zn-dependent protease
MDQRAAIMSRAALFALAAMTILAGCQTVQTTQPGVVGVERKQHMLVSSEQMDQAAADAYRKVLEGAKAKNALNKDPAQVERVRRVANRLMPNTGAFRPDVLDSPEVNAWCMPGGKIAVYSGLLAKINPSDDELAAVMGHEIAHALREHSREQASQQAAQGLVIGVLGAAAGVSDTTQQLSQMLLDVTFNLPHSRQDETEADRIGVELAARSGYDPHAAVTLWEKMMKIAGGNQPPQMLSTHPSSEKRIEDLKVYSEKVTPLYRQAKK